MFYVCHATINPENINTYVGQTAEDALREMVLAISPGFPMIYRSSGAASKNAPRLGPADEGYWFAAVCDLFEQRENEDYFINSTKEAAYAAALEFLRPEDNE